LIFEQLSINDIPEIVVKQNHRLVKGFLSIVIVASWVAGGLLFISEFLHKELKDVPVTLYVFLILWLAASVILILSLAWIVFGAVVVSIQDNALTIQRKMGSIMIGRRGIYAIGQIKNMRIEDDIYKYKSKIGVKHAITFNYLGHKLRMFSHLSKQEAESLLNGRLQKFVQNKT